MTREQLLVLRRLHRAVAAAKQAGLLVIADADAQSLRLIPVECGSVDLRQLGETVKLHGSCGARRADEFWHSV